MRRYHSLLALVASAAVMLVIAPDASAASTVCVGTITGVHDNVVVPGQTSSCRRHRSRIVEALEDSRLRISSSNVSGNVERTKADMVQILNSIVGGNIAAKEGGCRSRPRGLQQLRVRARDLHAVRGIHPGQLLPGTSRS